MEGGCVGRGRGGACGVRRQQEHDACGLGPVRELVLVAAPPREERLRELFHVVGVANDVGAQGGGEVGWGLDEQLRDQVVRREGLDVACRRASERRRG